MEDNSSARHSSFWGIMVIAGTVIGGGMFALPVDLAGAWFFLGRIYINNILVFNVTLWPALVRGEFKLSCRLQF